MLEKSESQNVTIVSRIYELLDSKDLPAVFSMLSPDVRITLSLEMPWGGTYVGPAEAQMLFEKLWVYIDSRAVVERIIDGGDRIPVIGRNYVTVGRTGRTFDVPFVHLWEFKDGLAIRIEIVSDIEKMRAAIGKK